MHAKVNYGKYNKEATFVEEGDSKPFTKEGNNEPLTKDGDWTRYYEDPLATRTIGMHTLYKATLSPLPQKASGLQPLTIAKAPKRLQQYQLS
jgi:hypothetical protein